MIQPVKNPIVAIHDLTVSYDKKPVVWDADIDLPSGNLIGIIGPNGAGKSTLLKAIMGLVPLDSGSIKLFGETLDRVRIKVSYVPQKESVDWNFPANVLDVVLMGRYAHLGLFQRPKKADRDFARDCLKEVGMESFEQRQIGQLSGGQQQRVFLARALAQQAQLYLLDEPFAGVDASTEGIIIRLLQKMTQQGKTIIVVHHDLHAVQQYFDWVVLLNMHIVAGGPTATTFVPTFIEKTYGNQFIVLSEVAQLLQEQGLPARAEK